MSLMSRQRHFVCHFVLKITDLKKVKNDNENGATKSTYNVKTFNTIFRQFITLHCVCIFSYTNIPYDIMIVYVAIEEK